jgi:hypothetical protein
MKVKASTIANIYPEDYEEPKKESIFPWGVWYESINRK